MMESKTIYLVRHGLATHSKRGYGKRKLTAPILPEGEAAIRRLAESLISVPDNFNISSEIIRCRQTSAIISEITGKQFTFDARLNEGNRETIMQIRQRALSFIQDVEKVPQKNIIICTHGVIIAAIKNLIITNKFVTRMMTDYPLPGELMIIDGNNVKMTNFN